MGPESQRIVIHAPYYAVHYVLCVIVSRVGSPDLAEALDVKTEIIKTEPFIEGKKLNLHNLRLAVEMNT